MDPRRRAQVEDVRGKRTVRTNAGRWSLLNEPQPVASDSIARAKLTDAAMESAARMLLARYGVLFRDVLKRESNAPKWRELLNILRRLEARGEVRGGRFVSGFGGEQFALPEAVESLREARKRDSHDEIVVAGADPMNLVGIVVPGERVAAVPGKEVRYRNGVVWIEGVEAAQPAVPAANRKRRFQFASAPQRAVVVETASPGLF